MLTICSISTPFRNLSASGSADIVSDNSPGGIVERAGEISSKCPVDSSQTRIEGSAKPFQSKTTSIPSMTLLSPPTSTILPTSLISFDSSERIIRSVSQRTSIWISALA